MGPQSIAIRTKMLVFALLLAGLTTLVAGPALAAPQADAPTAAGERIFLPLTMTLGAISATQEETDDNSSQEAHEDQEIIEPIVYDDCGVPLEDQDAELSCATETADE